MSRPYSTETPSLPGTPIARSARPSLSKSPLATAAPNRCSRTAFPGTPARVAVSALGSLVAPTSTTPVDESLPNSAPIGTPMTSCGLPSLEKTYGVAAVGGGDSEPPNNRIPAAIAATTATPARPAITGTLERGLDDSGGRSAGGGAVGGGGGAAGGGAGAAGGGAGGSAGRPSAAVAAAETR